MSNGIFKLVSSDFIKGLWVAVFAPVITAITVVLGVVINAAGFDVFAVDWATLSHNLVNISIVSAYGGLTGYLAKNFFSSNQGNVAGIGDK